MRFEYLLNFDIDKTIFVCAATSLLSKNSDMNEYIIGEKIKLRPATIGDKRLVFEWLTNTNLTKEMMGPPDYPDAKIPDWEEFDKDYLNHYFDGSEPFKGRCYIIVAEGQEVGQINYNAIDREKRSVGLDIWLSDKRFTGRGIGTEAIKLLVEYLHREFDCIQIVVSPSKRNRKAIRSYEKAGFVMTDIALADSEKDYNDNVVMVKDM